MSRNNVWVYILAVVLLFSAGVLVVIRLRPDGNGEPGARDTGTSRETSGEPEIDTALVERLTAAVDKYDRAESLMKAGDYEAAYRLFLEVKEDLKYVPMAEPDRKALEENLTACRRAMARAEDPEETPSLGQMYRTAMELADKGDYAGARKLLLSIKYYVKRDDLPLNPATTREIDRRLADIEKKLKDQPVPTDN